MFPTKRAAVHWLVAFTILMTTSPPVFATTQAEPSFVHGVGQVVAGLVFELPKTVLDATLTGPPIAGTVVGLLAGTARALQTTVGGLVEMAAGFDPWGTKK